MSSHYMSISEPMPVGTTQRRTNEVLAAVFGFGATLVVLGLASAHTASTSSHYAAQPAMRPVGMAHRPLVAGPGTQALGPRSRMALGDASVPADIATDAVSKVAAEAVTIAADVPGPMIFEAAPDVVPLPDIADPALSEAAADAVTFAAEHVPIALDLAKDVVVDVSEAVEVVHSASHGAVHVPHAHMDPAAAPAAADAASAVAGPGFDASALLAAIKVQALSVASLIAPYPLWMKVLGGVVAGATVLAVLLKTCGSKKTPEAPASLPVEENPEESVEDRVKDREDWIDDYQNRTASA